MEEQNIFFNPGNIVQIKQDIPNKPKMIVINKVTTLFKPNSKKPTSTLRGIKCMWFTENGFYQEQVFNTKDLILISK